MASILRRTVLLIAVAAAPSAQAQYSARWHSIDGGGGRSAGGAYTLSGSVGQADADLVPACSADGGPDCIAPAYRLESGFWVAFTAVSCTGVLNCLFRDGFEQLQFVPD